MLSFQGLAKAICIRVLAHPPVLEFISRRYARADQALVLNLHSVSPYRGQVERPLDPNLFKELVGFLVKHASVVPLGALSDPASLGRERPLVVLSFDDGHRDFLEYVMPVLASYSLRANLNVIGECIASRSAPWMWRMYDLMEHAPHDLIERLEVPGLRREGRGQHPETARARTARALSTLLKSRSTAARAPLLANIEDQLSTVEVIHPRRHLSTTELAEIARFHDIGMHSYAHASMQFESDNFFAEDFRRCDGAIQSSIGHRPKVYSFPNGSYRPSQIEILRTNGIAHIMLTGDRPTPVGTDVHMRIGLYGRTGGEVRVRAMGGLVWMSRFRSNVRGPAIPAATHPRI